MTHNDEVNLERQGLIEVTQEAGASVTLEGMAAFCRWIREQDRGTRSESLRWKFSSRLDVF